MIFADSLPFAKPFFSVLSVSTSTVLHLTRLVVACLCDCRSLADAANAIRLESRHRAQLARFLADQGFSRNWDTLDRLADLLLRQTLSEQGTWLFLLDQTCHGTEGRLAQSTCAKGNKKQRAKSSARRQKQTRRHSCHTFVFGLLISPVSGTRLPCVRAWHSKDYVDRFNAEHARTDGRRLVFRSQADLAAELILALKIPDRAEVLVLGDTAFEAKQVRAACGRRGFDWIVPANPERVLADTPKMAAERRRCRKEKRPQPKRRRLSDCGKELRQDRLIRIELCPGEDALASRKRVSRSKTGRRKYARRYRACAETMDVHNVGKVRVVFSTTEAGKNGSEKVKAQKILMSNRTDWDARRIVEAYAARWQIEQFFREMKSELGLSSYRMRDFEEVKGWVQGCCMAFVYLEWYRNEKRGERESEERWWGEQRTKGLKRQVRCDMEAQDLMRIVELAEGRFGENERHEGGVAARIKVVEERLRQAVPVEQRRPA